MFFLFLLYPALSMATMVIFNCDPNVGRLREDYRVVCPHVTAGSSLYSLVFLVLYPLGIPFVMHVALRYAGIVAVVKEKVENAEFHEILAPPIENQEKCPPGAPQNEPKSTQVALKRQLFRS
mgnify:CR=1 FL=1